MPAPDTGAETPSRGIAAKLFSDAKLRSALDEHTYAALVDTTKAERLFGWTPDWSWRQMA